MNKLLIFGLIGLFAVSIVSAAYIVNSFVLTTDVYEPFDVEYAIIGDAGNWDGVTTCDTYPGDWTPGVDVDVGGLFAGESRFVCAKITNAGEGDVDYTFEGSVNSGEGNFAECESAFGNPSVSGTVSGLATVKDGVAVIIAGDAQPIDDCELTLSVSRG